jgi:hypothetical protein
MMGVQQQNIRRRHQRAGNRQHLLLAAGQQARHLVATLPQLWKKTEHPFDGMMQAVALRLQVPADQQIVVNGHPGKYPAPLRRQGDALRDDIGRRHPVDPHVAEPDLALAGRPQPHDRPQRAGLAGAVAAHQRNDLGRRDVEADAADGDPMAVLDVDIPDLKRLAHAASSAPR